MPAGLFDHQDIARPGRRCSGGCPGVAAMSRRGSGCEVDPLARAQAETLGPRPAIDRDLPFADGLLDLVAGEVGTVRGQELVQAEAAFAPSHGEGAWDSGSWSWSTARSGTDSVTASPGGPAARRDPRGQQAEEKDSPPRVTPMSATLKV